MKKLSEAHKKAIGDAHRGKVLPQEVKDRISRAMMFSTNRAKITGIDVMDIRHLYSSRFFTQEELGKMYGLTPSAIGYTTQGVNWSRYPTITMPKKVSKKDQEKRERVLKNLEKAYRYIEIKSKYCFKKRNGNALAKEYGITSTQVHRIRRGECDVRILKWITLAHKHADIAQTVRALDS